MTRSFHVCYVRSAEQLPTWLNGCFGAFVLDVQQTDSLPLGSNINVFASGLPCELWTHGFQMSIRCEQLLGS